MKRIYLIILIAASVMTSCKDSSSNNETAFDEIKGIVDTTWNAFLNKHSLTHGGVGVQVITPDGYYFYQNKLADYANNKIFFRAGSTTKIFTAATILYLQERGLLNINDKITANMPGKDEPYLPYEPDFDIPFKNQITIKMLLQHRAGIFDVSNNLIPDTVNAPYAGKDYFDYVVTELGEPQHNFTFRELISICAKHHLYTFEPNTGYAYSNIGYSILGQIIERVTGINFNYYVKINLCDEYRCVNLQWPILGSEQTFPNTYANGWLFYNGQYLDVSQVNVSYYQAFGNLIATPFDLAFWLGKLMRGEAGVSKSTVQLMKDAPQPENYGLGLYKLGNYNLWGHNGAIAGYITYVFYNEELDATVSIFTNLWYLPDGTMDGMIEEMGVIEQLLVDIFKNLGMK
jgi:D-alanyl-D-alanine carboxypeptidase